MHFVLLISCAKHKKLHFLQTTCLSPLSFSLCSVIGDAASVFGATKAIVIGASAKVIILPMLLTLTKLSPDASCGPWISNLCTSLCWDVCILSFFFEILKFQSKYDDTITIGPESET